MEMRSLIMVRCIERNLLDLDVLLQQLRQSHFRSRLKDQSIRLSSYTSRPLSRQLTGAQHRRG